MPSVNPAIWHADEPWTLLRIDRCAFGRCVCVCIRSQLKRSWVLTCLCMLLQKIWALQIAAGYSELPLTQNTSSSFTAVILTTTVHSLGFPLLWNWVSQDKGLWEWHMGASKKGFPWIPVTVRIQSWKVTSLPFVCSFKWCKDVAATGSDRLIYTLWNIIQELMRVMFTVAATEIRQTDILNINYIWEVWCCEY